MTAMLDELTLFGIEPVLGSLEEAQFIYDLAKEDTHRESRQWKKVLPQGWSWLGCGGTRVVFLAPSGVAYKVCHRYSTVPGAENSNQRELGNFHYIIDSGKLPENWSIPLAHCYEWPGTDYKMAWDEEESRYAKIEYEVAVSVLAVEYINGEAIGECETEEEEINYQEMIHAFRAVGLYDTYGANAIYGLDGRMWIIDAAERMERK